MGKTRKNLIIILSCIVAFCTLCFLCIGFAALQTDLLIDGNLSAEAKSAVLNKAKLRAGLRKTPDVTQIFIGSYNEVVSSNARLTADDLTFIADVSDDAEGYGNTVGLFTVGTVAYILALGDNYVKFPALGGKDTGNLNNASAPDYSTHSTHPGYNKGCAYMFASYFPDLDYPADSGKGFDKVACLFNVTSIQFGRVDWSNTETNFEPSGYEQQNEAYEQKVIEYLDKIDAGETATEPVGDDYFGSVPKYRMFFHCEALQSIAFPEDTGLNNRVRTGIQKIAHAMFRGCYSLTSVSIPSSVTCIGSVAFGDCYALETCNLPSSVVSIGVGAFIWCTNISSVNLRATQVTKIRATTFRGVTHLNEVIIPDSVTSIGMYAFGNCVQIDGAAAVGGLETVTIGNSVTTINKKAFYQCNYLHNLTMGSDVASIGEDAFLGCQVAKAKIPMLAVDYLVNGYFKEVEIISGDTIGANAFSGSWQLKKITLPDSIQSVDDTAFSGCPITEATIPASAIKAVCNPPGFPDGNAHIIKLVITSGDEIADGVLEGRSNLKELSIAGTVTRIGNNAFKNCGGLTSVTLPSGVITIGEAAFNVCWQLASVYIPKTVTTIGANAFKGCSLETINYGGTKADWGNITLGTDWKNSWLHPVVKCTDGDLTAN